MKNKIKTFAYTDFEEVQNKKSAQLKNSRGNFV